MSHMRYWGAALAAALLLVLSACSRLPGLSTPVALQPTIAPTQARPTPTLAAPTAAPTRIPTQAPTRAPTAAPTAAPTRAPTSAPTSAPAAAPPQSPTANTSGAVVASYALRENANALRDYYRSQKIRAVVEETAANGRPLYRVRIWR